MFSSTVPYFPVNLADLLGSGSVRLGHLGLAGAATVFALAGRVTAASLRMALPQMRFPVQSRFQNYMADERSRVLIEGEGLGIGPALCDSGEGSGIFIGARSWCLNSLSLPPL